MVPAIEANTEAMRGAALAGFSTATDLADYLVRAGLPFRDAHEVVGQAVAHCVAVQCDLADLPLKDLQGFHGSIEEDVYDVLTLDGSVAARNHCGGTAPSQVKAAAQTVGATATSLSEEAAGARPLAGVHLFALVRVAPLASTRACCWAPLPMAPLPMAASSVGRACARELALRRRRSRARSAGETRAATSNLTNQRQCAP